MRRGYYGGGKIKNTFDSSVAAAKAAPLQGSSSTQQHRSQEIIKITGMKRGGRVNRVSKTMPDGVEGSAPSAFSPSASAGAGSSPAPAPKKRASGGRLPAGGADSGVGRLQLSRMAAKKMK